MPYYKFSELIMMAACYKSCNNDNKSDNNDKSNKNKNKVCLLLRR